MRRTNPFEPLEPIEPTEPLSHTIKRQHAHGLPLNPAKKDSLVMRESFSRLPISSHPVLFRNSYPRTISHKSYHILHYS